MIPIFLGVYVMLPFHGSYFSYHTLIIVAWPWLLWRKFQGFISNQCSTLSLPFLSLAVYSQFSWHVIATSIASQMPDGLVYSWVKTCRSKGESVQITRNERCNWVTLWGGLNHWFGSYGPSFFMQVKSPILSSHFKYITLFLSVINYSHISFDQLLDLPSMWKYVWRLNIYGHWKIWRMSIFRTWYSVGR